MQPEYRVHPSTHPSDSTAWNESSGRVLLKVEHTPSMTDQICYNIASTQSNVPAAQDAQAATMRSCAKSVALTIDRGLPVHPLTYMAVSMLSSGWEMKSASNVTVAVSVEPMDISTHWALAFDRSGLSDNHQSMKMVSPVRIVNVNFQPCF